MALEEAEAASGNVAYPTNLPDPLPFVVHRSRMGNLPVYTDLRNGSREVTIVRKIGGDVTPLAHAMEELCRSPVTLFHGRIEVKGTHKARLIGWLGSLGF